MVPSVLFQPLKLDRPVTPTIDETLGPASEMAQQAKWPSKRNGDHDEMVAYPDYKRHTKADSGKTEGLPIAVRRHILLNERESGNVDIVAYPDYRRGLKRSA